MFRKLALVGLVLLVGRGSVAQLSAAVILSFGFFALQMYTWPYKLYQVKSLCHALFGRKPQAHCHRSLPPPGFSNRTTCSAQPPKFMCSLSSLQRLC
eukprot:COSAG04_NODE_1186_length_7862_cov_2.600541_2_plen_97_part_00